MTDTPSISASTKFVTVGCKVPNGLLLQLRGKNREVIAEHSVVGANATRIIGGYGITENIPAEFFQQWMERNKTHPAVKNGSVFMHTEMASARDIAKDRREVKTGLEPIDPETNGMLQGDDGENDKGAIRKYREQKAQNPSRNLQIQE